MPEHAHSSEHLREALAQIAPFDQIPMEDLHTVAAQSQIKHCPAGSVILEPGMGPPEAFFVILTGQVHGQTPQPPHETVWTLSRGDSFPLGALLEQRAVTTRQVVTEPTELIRIPVAAFEQLRQNSQAFADFSRQRIGYLINRPQTGSSSEPNVLDTQTPVARRVETNPIRLPADTPIAEAAAQLEQSGREALLVDFSDTGKLGLVTLRDLAFRGLARARDPNTAIGELASIDPVGIDAQQSVLDAAILLAEHGFHHLLVTENNSPCGILAESDLYRVNRATPGVLKARILRAASVEALKPLRAQIPAIGAELVESGVRFASASQIISGLNEAIAQRVIALVMDEAPLPADIEWCWLTFGSEARHEQTLATDQDNGLVFKSPRDAERVRDWLLPRARQINQALDQLDYPLCPGNIMAQNPALCLSLDEWHRQFTRWIDQGTPEHLLKASIFFDARMLAGSEALFTDWTHAWREPAAKNGRFQKQMAANALRLAPPLGFFGRFQTQTRNDKATLDLKTRGATPFVDAARIKALAEQNAATRTIDRLSLVPERSIHQADLQAAYAFIQDLRLQHQVRCWRAGISPDNHIDPNNLDGLEQRLLKESFRIARKLQQHLTITYQL